MKVITVIGQTYALRSMSGGDLTNEAGDVLETLEPGVQLHVTAQEPAWVLPGDCQVTACRTFKNASLALRLLGGGKNDLPAGYLYAQFLESDGRSAVINSEHQPNDRTGLWVKMQCLTWGGSYYLGCQDGSGSPSIWIHRPSADWSKGFVFSKTAYNVALNYNEVFEFKANWLGSKQIVSQLGVENMTDLTPYQWTNSLKFFRSAFGSDTRYDNGNHMRLFIAKITQDAEIVRYMIPCISDSGEAGMYCLASKRFFANEATGSFIAGFTLAQARKLGKLPAGTTRTVSLPVGYDSDAGVINALAQAQENGCVLTIQTYEAAGAAAATYALRRIWVRKVQDENGTYVDADGSRWQVEWCVDVIGADPESLGYERFRSEEVAAEDWGLQPYQYPEEEQLLTEA